MKTLNNSAIRNANRRLIAQTIFRNPNITQAQLLQKTGMSSHTLITIVKELEDASIIQRGALQESTGGRPPMSLMIRPDSRYALGAAVERGELVICLTDFGANVVDLRRFPMECGPSSCSLPDPVVPESCFTQFLPACAADMLRLNDIPAGKLMGLALTVKGWIENGIWHCGAGEYDVSRIRQACETALDIPFLISRNDILIGMSESWFLNEKNMLSLILDDGIGGVIIRDGQMDLGLHGRSGSFGHTTLHPGGKQCICGKRGCLGVYCSAFSLLVGPYSTLEGFFADLAENRGDALGLFDRYLQDLALGISNLAMITDRTIVISGEMANYLEPYWTELTARVADAAGKGFMTDICLGKLRRNASAIAAACHQQQMYFTNNL